MRIGNARLTVEPTVERQSLRCPVARGRKADQHAALTAAWNEVRARRWAASDIQLHRMVGGRHGRVVAAHNTRQTTPGLRSAAGEP